MDEWPSHLSMGLAAFGFDRAKFAPLRLLYLFTSQSSAGALATRIKNSPWLDLAPC
jgi:hypothetical protein